MCEHGGEGHESRGEPGGPPPSPRLRPGRPAGPPRISGAPSPSGVSSTPSHETQGPPQAALDLAHPMMATPCPPAPAPRKLVHLPRVPQARPGIPPHGPARGRATLRGAESGRRHARPPPARPLPSLRVRKRFSGAHLPPEERVPRDGSSRRSGKPRLPPPLPTPPPRPPCPADGPAPRARDPVGPVPQEGATRAEGGGRREEPTLHRRSTKPSGSRDAAHPLPLGRESASRASPAPRPGARGCPTWSAPRGRHGGSAPRASDTRTQTEPVAALRRHWAHVLASSRPSRSPLAPPSRGAVLSHGPGPGRCRAACRLVRR